MDPHAAMPMGMAANARPKIRSRNAASSGESSAAWRRADVDFDDRPTNRLRPNAPDLDAGTSSRTAKATMAIERPGRHGKPIAHAARALSPAVRTLRLR